MTAALPWFPFFPDDFQTSQSVRLMTYEQRGIYIDLLCYQWRDGGIPADIEDRAALLGIDLDRMESAWKRIGKLFETDPSDPSRLVNARLEDIRAEQEEKRRVQAEKGRKAMEKRWGPKPGDSPAITEPVAGDNQKEEEKEKEKETAKAVNKGASRPDLFDAFGDAWRTDRLAASWASFCDHRRQLGVKQYSQTGLKALLAMVTKAGMGPDDLADLIDQAVSRNWQGIPSERIQGWKPKGLQIAGPTGPAPLADRKAQLAAQRAAKGAA